MMYLREFHLGLSQYQPEISGRIVSGLKHWLLRCLLAILFCAFLMEPSMLFADSPIVTHEIRYHRPEASEVFLVWGVNGWNLLPEELYPAGTVIENEVMNTPMARQGETFSISVQVPVGTIIDYGFWIVEETDDGTDARVWGGDKESIVVAPDGFVTQEFRYYMPEASEVLFIWGINGWNLLPEDLHPAGTTVQDGMMNTPMVREHDTFVVQVYVPAGATIDYGFTTTKTRQGDPVEIWDGDENSIVAMPGRVVEVKAAVIVEQTETPAGMLDVVLYLLIGIIIVFGIGIILYVVRFYNHRALALTLFGLILLGLMIRLWMVWNTNQYPLDIPSQLLNGELVYNDLAYSLWQGSFFQWPGYASLYSLFLAVCYAVFGQSYLAVFCVQAFVGVTVIPLTFRMARHFTGVKLSLLAAALAALHPALIFHTTRLSNEILYTPLLLLALLSLLWALKTLELHRFIYAGVLLAVANLCHPSALLFPIILLLLLPGSRRFRKRKAMLVAYAGAMIVVLVPWSLYNSLTHNSLFPLSIPGTSLWQGSPDFFALMENKVSMPQIWNEHLNPKNNGGHDPLTIEGDLYFAHRALASIAAQPGDYVLYSFLKLVFFWIGHPAIDWPDYTLFETEFMRPYFSAPRIAGIFATRLLPLIALLVLIILHQVHGRTHSLVPLLIVCGYFMLVHTITYPEMRYSEPLHPILVTIIAASMKPKEQESISLRAGIQGQWYFA